MKNLYILLLISFNSYSDTIIYSSSFVDVNSGQMVKNKSIRVDQGYIKSIDSGFIKITK
jgi:hypothetical protein